MPWAFCASARGWCATEKWKAAGSSTAIMLILSNVVFRVAPKIGLRKEQVLGMNINLLTPNACVKPPANKPIPRTRTAWTLVRHD